jgi:putative transcriptional regulator
MKNMLKELRAQHGMTQADLAERLRVSRQTVIAIESSRYDPSLPLAFAVAKVFNRSIEEIFVPQV